MITFLLLEKLDFEYTDFSFQKVSLTENNAGLKNISHPLIYEYILGTIINNHGIKYEYRYFTRVWLK